MKKVKGLYIETDYQDKGAVIMAQADCPRCGGSGSGGTRLTGGPGGRSVGRNEPCICGSPKKYKKCCMGKAVQAPGSAPVPCGCIIKTRVPVSYVDFGAGAVLGVR
jgi:hypothetical protein